MPILQVRELPDGLYQKLARQARKEHRSLAQQAVVELYRALDMMESTPYRRKTLVEKIDEWQREKNFDDLPGPEAMIREDRSR